MSDAVVISVQSNRFDADVVRTRLESHGISAWVRVDDAGSQWPVLTLLTGASVLVAESDAAEARTILGEDAVAD